MLTLILTSFILYISSNVDNLMILLMLYATAKTNKTNVQISLGQFFGTFTLVLISMFATIGTSLLPSIFIKILGLIPILLGLKIIYYHKKNVNSGSTNESHNLVSISIAQVTLLTIANGADNIGVYVPVFTNYNYLEYVVTMIVFTISTIMICYLGKIMANVSEFKKLIESKQHIFVPTILILLGFIIIFS